jgi:hypothetical protein
LVAPSDHVLMKRLNVWFSAVEDAAGQPGVRPYRLMGRDLSIHNPRTDAASIIDEATAHGLQLTLVQFPTVSVAALSHGCLPLAKEGPSPLIWWSQVYPGRFV